MDTPATIPTTEERLLAGLSHLFGLMVALIIFFVERQKSRYVALQAMQSVLFSICLSGMLLLAMGCLFTLIFGGAMIGVTAMAGAEASGSDPGLAAILFALPFAGFWLLFPILICVSFAASILRWVVAIFCFTGKEIRYPILAGWAEKLAA
jgi:uncharacterized membrane protein